MKLHFSLSKLLSVGSIAAALMMICTIPVQARYSYHSYKSGSVTGIFIQIGVVVLFNVGIVIYRKYFRKKKRAATEVPADYTMQIRNEVNSYDPSFNDYTLVRMAESYFDQYVSAVSDREPERLRTLETEELYQRQKNETDDLLNAGRIRLLSHAKIESSYLHLYRRDKNYEYITVCLRVQIKDYIINQQDYQLVDGKKVLQYQHYLLTYMRSNESRLDSSVKRIQTHCPNCGAPIQLNSSRQCAFCQAIIRADSFDWVLYDVEVLAEGEKADNRGILIEDNENVKFTKENSPFFTGYYDNGIQDNYKNPFTRVNLSEDQHEITKGEILRQQLKIDSEFPDQH